MIRLAQTLASGGRGRATAGRRPHSRQAAVAASARGSGMPEGRAGHDGLAAPIPFLFFIQLTDAVMVQLPLKIAY